MEKQIIKSSEDIHRRHVRYMDAVSMNNIYKLQASKDYIFLHYALHAGSSLGCRNHI